MKGMRLVGPKKMICMPAGTIFVEYWMHNQEELKNDMKLFVADELCEILYRFENKDIFLKDYLSKRIEDLRGTNKCE